jgi:hypothetical protein
VERTGRGVSDARQGIYTVNNLRSINLLFSSMFGIERKIDHVGAKKSSSRYISNKFALNWNFICGIRSIEHKMRPILYTV